MPPRPQKQLPTKKKSSGSVIDRIQQLKKLETPLKILLYGESGSGKTTLWGSFPGQILAVICSGGNKTGELLSLGTEELRKKIKHVTLETATELREIVDYCEGNPGFKTIVLDHVSGLQDMVLKEILGIEKIPEQKGWGVATQQQYGQCTQQCKEYLRALLNLNLNVVIIGQQRTFGGRDDGLDPELISPTVGVATVPSLAGWLYPACDYVLQTFKRPVMEEVVTKIGNKEHKTRKRGKGVQYCVRCEPHDVFTTKFRVPKGTPLPDVIVDPSYEAIMAVINGESAPKKKAVKSKRVKKTVKRS